MPIAGAVVAEVDKALLSRCVLWKRGVITFRNYTTDICITDDQQYVVVDPQPPEELKQALALAVLRGAIPPDYNEYDRAIKDALFALRPKSITGLRWYRNALARYREHRPLIHYLLDRWTGHGEFGGYGTLEAPMRDELLTEIVVPMPPTQYMRWLELPKNPRELLQKIENEVIELTRFRRVVAVRNEIRMPTNIIIPEHFMPLLVKKLIPGLTLDRPFQTREDQIYKLRIAADLLEYNVNIRKMSEFPRPTPRLIKVYETKPSSNERTAYAKFMAEVSGIDVFSLATIALEARWTVIFSGGMGSGKTTQLNLLLYFVPTWFQVVIVERGAREIWAPLEGQLLHISVPSEDKLEVALDQALRYGTVDTIVALAEARTSKELYTLVGYKLTGHGGVTTMHADTIHDALLRVRQSGAPPEALSGTLILQLGISAGARYLKEWAALAIKSGQVQIVEPEEVLALLNEYTMATYGVDILNEIKLRSVLVKAVAEKELEPHNAREVIVKKIFSRRTLSIFDDAVRFGYTEEAVVRAQ